MKVGRVVIKVGEAVVVAALLVAALSAFACGRAPKGEQVRPEGGVFSVDVHALAPGQVRFYRYDTGGKSVVFFVARGQSGAVKAAFDACASCYPRKRGYRAGDGTVTCAACGMVFRIDELDQGNGNCVPVALRSTSSGGSILIDSRDLEQGADLF